MAYKCYSQIRLLNDNYKHFGVLKGTIGIILEIYSTGDYEVQFLDRDGDVTDKFFSVRPEDVEQYTE